jgi:hypothetical protein
MLDGTITLIIRVLDLCFPHVPRATAQDNRLCLPRQRQLHFKRKGEVVLVLKKLSTTP